MGRTISKFRDDDEDRRKNKVAKHSKNIPGKGMRVINNWSEDNLDDPWIEDESDDEYYAYTSQTQRK